MILQKLRIVNYRSYTNSKFEFHKQLNFLNGENGSGKTSILEAVHFLALTKSFRTHSDSDVVRNSELFFQIFGVFNDNFGKENSVNVNFSKTEGKRIFFNKVTLKRRIEMVGRIPVIILSPGNQRITEGGPAGRRNFVNRIVAQIDKKYFSSLIEYRNKLAQRNLILNSYRKKGLSYYDSYIEAYDELFAESAKNIQIGRINFIEKFDKVFKKKYKKISHIKCDVSIKINYNVNANEASFKEIFLNRLQERFSKDIVFGKTGCGPHLDNVMIIFNGKEIRQVGSQGEHKIVLVALKMAEGQFIEGRLKKSIIFLLDDLFSLLDVKHCMKIIDEISSDNQVFITSTDLNGLYNYGFKRSDLNSEVFELPVGVF